MVQITQTRLILHIGNVFNTIYRSRHWSINSYKSLDFLVFDQIESPPFLISDYSDNEVSLKLYFSTIKDFKMTKIGNVKDTNGIVGSWVWPFQNNQDLPLPPPPPNLPLTFLSMSAFFNLPIQARDRSAFSFRSAVINNFA